MPDTDPLADAERRLAESEARSRALEAQQRAEEAAAVMGRVATAEDLERLDIHELDAMRDAAPDAYAEMRTRLLRRYDPAAHLREQMESHLNDPSDRPRFAGDPLTDADLDAALDAAGDSRTISEAVLFGVSDEQLARLKADPGPRGTAFRRSLQAVGMRNRETVAWVE